MLKNMFVINTFLSLSNTVRPMHKLYFTFLAFLFSHFTGYAQLGPNETPRLLVKRIQKTRPDTNRVKLQLQLGCYYLFKEGAFKNDLDSAFIFFNRALCLSDTLHSIKWHNEVLKLKGDCYLEAEDLANGTTCFMQVINYYHKAGEMKNEANTWDRFGDCITYKNNAFIDKRIYCYDRARSLFKQLKDTLNGIRILKDEADTHLYQKKVGLAEMELKQVLTQYKAIHYKNLHYTYDLLAAASALKGDLRQELFYRIEVVKSMEATGDMEDAPNFYYSLAKIYYHLEIYDQKTALIKGMAYCKKVKDYGILGFFINLYARILLKENKKAEEIRFLQSNVKTVQSHVSTLDDERHLEWMYCEIYQGLGNYQLAEKHFKKRIKLTDRDDSRSIDLAIYIQEYMDISTFYIDNKQFLKADQYVKRLARLPKNGVGILRLNQISLLQFKVDSAAGHYLAAIGDFELNKKIADSLLDATKTKQIAEMETKYETGLKDKDLQLQQKNIQLLTKQSQLKGEQVIQTRTTKNMWVGGSCILFLLTAVTYNRYRLKQRSNLQLQRQKIEISDKNATLEGLLHDNEWMMRELHHRVKNNMQMVMSLLSSQAAYLNDEVAIKTVTESQHRIQAMSLIHQKLYKTNNVSNIYMPEYIYELVDYLKDSFKLGPSIYFDLQIDAIFLDVLQAVPIGLILNEAITNAIKYAFPHSREDTVTVRLAALTNDEISLSINDNGRGLPDDFNSQRSNTFGMILIQGLARDLGGSYTIVSDNGTSVTVKFQMINILQTALKKADKGNVNLAQAKRYHQSN